MHVFSENKERNDFGNRFGGGEIADTLNVETLSTIFYRRFCFYYNWSTSSTFKERKRQKIY